MLLHHILHWPQEARLELWPFAVDYSVWIWNHLPDITTRLSPIEVFTKSSFPDNRHLQRVRVFGCPVYVLHPTLQDAKKLPKWQRKSWRGIFLGFSPNHSTNVNLVLNPETGSITPQYHVVFDEKFSTTASTVTEDSLTPAVHLWDTLRADGYEQHQSLQDSSDDFLPPDSFLDPSNQTERIDHSVEPPTIAETPDDYPLNTLQPADQLTPDPELQDVLPDEPTEIRRTTRSGRESKQPKHLRDFILLNNLSKQTSFAPTRKLPRVRCEVLNHQRLSTLRWDDLLTSIRGGSYGALLSFTQQHSDEGFLNEWHPSLLSVGTNFRCLLVVGNRLSF
jgi:hypothetical protein